MLYDYATYVVTVSDVRLVERTGRAGHTVIVGCNRPGRRLTGPHRIEFHRQYGHSLGADLFARNDAERIEPGCQVQVMVGADALLNSAGVTIYLADSIRVLTYDGCTCRMQPERCAVHAEATA